MTCSGLGISYQTHRGLIIGQSASFRFMLINENIGALFCSAYLSPADSCKEVTAIADYVLLLCGGHGAVRDSIEYPLTKSGHWSKCVEKVYGLAGM
jgi:hypothetical protein